MSLRIGHRGAAGTYPENTMASFRRAVELGAQGIEFDVHLTADGRVVVIHDPFLDRTTSGTGRVGDLTLSELQELDAGAWKGGQFAGEWPPSLDELFQWAPPDLQLFVEVKGGSDVYPGIEQILLDMIADYNVRERVQFSSFDHEALRRLRALDPTVPIGMLYVGELPDAVAQALAMGANALHPKHTDVTPELVAQAHAAGLTVNTWTVNQPEDITRIRACGVDGIMSDFPERLQS